MDSYTPQYGRKTVFEPGMCIYRQGEPLGETPVYFIEAGLVKLEIALKDGSRFPFYLHPGSVFGLVESMTGCPRLSHALVMEKSIAYNWTAEDFELDLGISMKLALSAATGLTRLLRILNAEFGERIGLLAGRS